ncbi:MAG: sugar phosphate isomerase/epimerase [Ruminococcaceae bacterium]|nr:sugar phosphate isomerase/epimerase [Oscillospiraceae bacterium]
MYTFKIGLQLYSVHSALQNDLVGTLSEIKRMGYDVVEFTSLYGRTAAELREICDGIGLEILTYAQDITPILESPEQAVSMLKTLGAQKYSVGFSAQDLTEKYDECVEKLRFASSALHKNDLQLLYHNHDTEFALRRKEMPVIYALCNDVPYMGVELDTCWCQYGGEDPAATLRRLGAKVPCVHLKDFVCENLPKDFDFARNVNGAIRNRLDDGFLFRPLGKGLICTASVLDIAKENNIQYIIVEQDYDYITSAMEDMAQSREYLYKMGC